MVDEEKQQEEGGPLPRTREAVDWWLKKWGRAEVVEGTEPLTREDVERLIRVNGGTFERLFLEGANLQDTDLCRANLQGARLWQANLQGADLLRANLQGADLWQANLQGAYLGEANLQGTDLREADLQDAWLAFTQLSASTNLERVTWDKGYISILEREGQYEEAVALYRRLKEWHKAAGMLVIAGEFHYREEAALTKLHGQRLTQDLRKEFGEFKRRLAMSWQRLRGAGGSTELNE